MFRHNDLRNATLVTSKGEVKFDAEGIVKDVPEEIKPILQNAIDITEIETKKATTKEKSVEEPKAKEESTPKTATKTAAKTTTAKKPVAKKSTTK